MAGMKISLGGILTRSAERLERTKDAKDLGWMLGELLKHLEELREDRKLIDDFFDLYRK